MSVIDELNHKIQSMADKIDRMERIMAVKDEKIELLQNKILSLENP